MPRLSAKCRAIAPDVGLTMGNADDFGENWPGRGRMFFQENCSKLQFFQLGKQLCMGGGEIAEVERLFTPESDTNAIWSGNSTSCLDAAKCSVGAVLKVLGIPKKRWLGT